MTLNFSLTNREKTKQILILDRSRRAKTKQRLITGMKKKFAVAKIRSNLIMALIVEHFQELSQSLCQNC